MNARIGWKALTAAEYVPDGFAFLSTPNIKGDEIDFENVNFISEFRYRESPELQLRVGDVLLVKDGNTLGITNVVKRLPRPATVNGSIAVLRTTLMHPGFLRYALDSDLLQGLIGAFRAGMGVPHLFQADIKKFPLPCPAFTEQRAIADFLDVETARIDALIEKEWQMIDLLIERRDASVEWAVSGSTSVRVPVSSVLAAKITDGPHETPEFIDDGVPFLSVNNVVDGRLVFEGCRRIALSAHRIYAMKCLPRRGDVLVTKAASVGEVALVETDVEFNVWSPLAVLRPDPVRITPEFLYFALRTREVQDQIQLAATSNTQQNIAMGVLGSLRVSLPSVATQTVIATELSARFAMVDDVTTRLKRQIDLLSEHRQALITAAVTGELDVAEAA